MLAYHVLYIAETHYIVVLQFRAVNSWAFFRRFCSMCATLEITTYRMLCYNNNTLFKYRGEYLKRRTMRLFDLHLAYFETSRPTKKRNCAIRLKN